MLVNTKEITNESTLVAERVAMSIDESSLVHIMTLLSDLYSNPAGAVAREYGTNALDSHLEAGQTRPVLINTPSTFNSYLTIQDFGVGLSADDLRKIYSKFGASTKRDSNLQAGMLGLGCKSALTYTDQFTIDSVKDGIRVLAVISRETDGTGVINIVSQVASTEPNGVTIKVTCSDVGKMTKEVLSFARFVTPGALLVNGAEIKHGLEMITPEFGIELVDDGSYDTTDRVVMGNVSYPVDRSQISRMYSNRRVVVYVPMGSVDFTPSREELFYSDRTKRFLNLARERFHAELQTYIYNRIESCSDKVEAYKVAVDIRAVHGTTIDLSYDGEPVPREIAYVDSINIHSGGVIKRGNGIRLTTVGSDSVIITGWKNARMNKAQYDKVVLAFEPNGSNDRRFYLIGDSDYLSLFDAKNVYKWEDVVKFKPAKSVTTRTAASRTYDTLTRYGRANAFAPVDPSKGIVYGQWNKVRSNYRALAQLAGDDNIVYLIPESQQDNFVKAHPTAISFREMCAQQVRDYNSTVTDAELDLSLHRNYDKARFLNAEDILDPVLKARCTKDSETPESAAIRQAAAERRSVAQQASNYCTLGIKYPATADDSGKSDYILLDEASCYAYGDTITQFRADMTEYVNSKYMSNLQKGKDSAV